MNPILQYQSGESTITHTPKLPVLDFAQGFYFPLSDNGKFHQVFSLTSPAGRNKLRAELILRVKMKIDAPFIIKLRLFEKERWERCVTLRAYPSHDYDLENGYYQYSVSFNEVLADLRDVEYLFVAAIECPVDVSAALHVLKIQLNPMSDSPYTKKAS